MSRGLSLSDLSPEMRQKIGAQAKGRTDIRPHGMNKTESRRADYLDMLKRAGEIHDWRFEAMNLRLGDNTFLKIDFLIVGADGQVELEDVKGRKGEGPWVEEDARAKIYAAASMYPWFKFSIVWEGKDRTWQRREIRPC